MTDRIQPLTSRRTFVSVAAQLAAAVALGCGDSTEPTPTDPSRLHFHAYRPSGGIDPGLQPLGLEIGRDGMLYVPATYKPSEALPLVILLHGAGGSGSDFFGSYGGRADAARVILLAPDCRFGTWDAVQDQFIVDVDFISRAISYAFSRCAIDARRMAIFGFSDGASYALSLGLANGDQIPHIAAFSPGKIVDAPRHGTPDFFISHGTVDSVLPIDQTSRVIVPTLRAAGYDVTYTEFFGDHELPSDISAAAFAWLAARGF